ncbi:MAG: thioredoxin domain-containing protein, partial [Solirubrobacteraceae bacterium]
EDSPLPSGNSAAAFGLLRLALLSGEGKYERHALGVLRLLYPLAIRHPHAFGHLLQAVDFYLSPVREIAIVGPESEARELVRAVRGRYRPHIVLAGGDADGVALLEGRTPVDGHAAAYVCEHFLCQAPVSTPDELAAALDA